MIKYIHTHNFYDCCGCRACEQACTHKALSFEEDKEGFIYPVLNSSLCVNCGLCAKVCPMMTPNEALYEEGLAYVAQNIDSEELKTSSSGGAFIAIAKHIINNERVESIEELEKLKGSKYVQSDTRNAYTQIKNDLKNGLIVYFTGTPCQVAGLKLFLRKDYDNLLISDLICHGTPSPSIFKKTVEHLEKKLNASFKGYSFRDKRVRGWSCCCSSSYKKQGNNKEIYINYSKEMEAYFKAFISGHMMRMNCYKCPFASTNRCGDITLADFWGVREEMPDFPNIHKGVSLLLINSDKGKYFWNKIKDKFIIRQVSMETAKNTNANLKQPTPFSNDRKSIYDLALNNYPQFLKKYYSGNYYLQKFKVQTEYTIRKHPWIFSTVSKIKKLLK